MGSLCYDELVEHGYQTFDALLKPRENYMNAKVTVTKHSEALEKFN